MAIEAQNLQSDGNRADNQSRQQPFVKTADEVIAKIRASSHLRELIAKNKIGDLETGEVIEMICGSSALADLINKTISTTSILPADVDEIIVMICTDPYIAELMSNLRIETKEEFLAAFFVFLIQFPGFFGEKIAHKAVHFLRACRYFFRLTANTSLISVILQRVFLDCKSGVVTGNFL